MKNDRIKRSALGNLTNAVISTDSDEILKKGSNAAPTLVTKISNESLIKADNVQADGTKLQPISSRTRNAARVQLRPTGTKKLARVNTDLLPPPKDIFTTENNNKSRANEVSVITTAKIKATDTSKNTRRISNDFEKTEESLYVSALDDISDISRLSSDTRLKQESSNFSLDRTLSSSSSVEYSSCEDLKVDTSAWKRILPPGVDDFDKENWNDPYQVSHYAMDIFEYLKQREQNYKIKDYMSDQQEISKWMRSLLVDWMVEVQESFELNHETLYLAVKIVDTYLGKERVKKDNLQLLGAASLFISCKNDVNRDHENFLDFSTNVCVFQERTPPLIDDFLFICDGAYKRSQLLKMEMAVFRSIDFDLAFPLSYRFLRRYARVS